MIIIMIIRIIIRINKESENQKRVRKQRKINNK